MPIPLFQNAAASSVKLAHGDRLVPHPAAQRLAQRVCSVAHVEKALGVARQHHLAPLVEPQLGIPGIDQRQRRVAVAAECRGGQGNPREDARVVDVARFTAAEVDNQPVRVAVSVQQFVIDAVLVRFGFDVRVFVRVEIDRGGVSAAQRSDRPAVGERDRIRPAAATDRRSAGVGEQDVVASSAVQPAWAAAAVRRPAERYSAISRS